MAKTQINRSIKVPDDLIIELLTSSEIRMLNQRYQILHLIQEGESVRVIARKAGVGTDTVMRMIRKLEQSQKLQENFLPKSASSKMKSKWVFGETQTEEEE